MLPVPAKSSKNRSNLVAHFRVYRASLDPDLIIRYSSRQRPGQSEDIPEVRLLAPLPSGLLFSTLTRDVTNADDLIQSSAMGLLTLTAFLRTVAVGEAPETFVQALRFGQPLRYVGARQVYLGPLLRGIRIRVLSVA